MIPAVFGLAPVIPPLTVSLLSLRNRSVSVSSCGCLCVSILFWFNTFFLWHNSGRDAPGGSFEVVPTGNVAHREFFLNK